jgi:trimethylamine:corrinoid methyltransferase-like protein
MKLTQYFNCIHVAGGYPVEPIDIHPSVRHLDCLYEKLTLTDKVVPRLFAGGRAGRGRDGDGPHRRAA